MAESELASSLCSYGKIIQRVFALVFTCSTRPFPQLS